MKEVIDAFLSRNVMAWVDTVQHRATSISWMSVVLTLLLGTYAALELRINLISYFVLL